MIPVLRVTGGMGDQQKYATKKRPEQQQQQQLQRQDSGFLSGAPTPVTPSRPDMSTNQAVPAGGNCLPPIPERSTDHKEEMASIIEKVKECIHEEEEEEEDEEEELTSSIRPSRPTTLSPHAPPPKEDKLTALTPGTVLRHFNENPGHLSHQFKEYIERRADKIVQEVVPETPTSVSNLSHPHHDVPSELELAHPTPPPPLPRPMVPQSLFPIQEVLYPIDQEYLHCGSDGKYYEIRDFDRADNEILGEGGFGTVYACIDHFYQRMFAIKCNKHNSEEKVSNMNVECRVLRHIGPHSHITQLHGALVDDYSSSCLYEGKRFKMLMEMATNGSLNELLYDPDTGEPSGLPSNQSLFYLQQILYAVHFLHQRAILHLDLKCANVLLFNEGRIVKLTDFGSAVRLDEAQGCQIRSNKGLTPNFSAPEAIRCEYVSFSADIWSVLCCLVEMITGQLPWCYGVSRDPLNVIMLVGHYDEAEEQKYFRSLVPEVAESEDPRILSLFQCVFRRDPKRRPTALNLLEHPLIKDAHEYEKEFDDCQYEPVEGEDIAPPLLHEATPSAQIQAESAASANVAIQKSKSNESRSSVDSGVDTERSSSSSSSPGSANGGLVANKTTFNIGPYTETIMPSSGGSGPNVPVSFVTTTSGLTSSSAPPDFNGGCWEEPLDDIEKDGPKNRVLSRKLKRTTSANYVSNGPEVDSPDGKLHNRNFSSVPPKNSNSSSSSFSSAYFSSASSFSSTVFPSNMVTVGMVSVGTQTSSLSPTVESVSPFGSHMVLSSSGYR